VDEKVFEAPNTGINFDGATRNTDCI